MSKAEPPKTGQKVPVKKAETQSIEKISKSLEDKNQATIMELVMGQDMKYSSKGKIDPFTPLVREKEASPPQANGALPEEEPKRVLTPLEKMELSQLKLVAVILMENKKIAMVEEATGKGYEVGIGTYMGKDSGQVTQINQSSIIIKEIVKDYKGNRKERFQEMKLHKRDSGE
ncbi:pilus assembly protein PilP [Desulfospira joergensenii]|uniref:pilus assembly protein PilP n=1 Tax=Desulfospira joergensenii TaxID=53329 RepID=UPI0013787909|nr:pilus assembly protein PilP [Desulfospira joergensenii]